MNYHKHSSTNSSFHFYTYLTCKGKNNIQQTFLMLGNEINSKKEKKLVYNIVQKRRNDGSTHMISNNN